MAKSCSLHAQGLVGLLWMKGLSDETLNWDSVYTPGTLKNPDGSIKLRVGHRTRVHLQPPLISWIKRMQNSIPKYVRIDFLFIINYFLVGSLFRLSQHSCGSSGSRGLLPLTKFRLNTSGNETWEPPNSVNTSDLWNVLATEGSSCTKYSEVHHHLIAMWQCF